MINYIYKCANAHEQVITHRMADQPTVICAAPNCQLIMKKIPSFAAPKFNGPGFYSTDKSSTKDNAR